MDDNIIYHPLWEIDNGYNVNICQWCLENPMIMCDNGKCILQILRILLDGMIFCDVRGRLLTLTVDLIHLIRTWYLDSESLAFAHRKYGILFNSFPCQASKIPDTSTQQRDWIHLDLYDISDFALQGCWNTLEWLDHDGPFANSPIIPSHPCPGLYWGRSWNFEEPGSCPASYPLIQ